MPKRTSTQYVKNRNKQLKIHEFYATPYNIIKNNDKPASLCVNCRYKQTRQISVLVCYIN